ncbi:MAG: tyrosine protein kinase [Solirubrobacteraceae bacterium]|nr:tyrosine protein kinase [Solirubrobacteraceae bacterium]
MGLATHPPESDLVLPLPEAGETWDPHTIHTHYFGFAVPEARIGAFLYVRYQPAFPLSQGGVALFRGLDNVHTTDLAHLDYQMTMPWPTVEGNVITTANGLRIEFLEPGRKARVSYDAGDGTASFDTIHEAVTPLLARGHIVPGEDDHHGTISATGGTEQFMHATGTLTLDGETFEIDSYYPRDRSWGQVRQEKRGGPRPMPPVSWTPMYFGDDLIFNQISVEHPDANPGWKGVFEFPEGAPTHHFAWVVDGGETKEIVRVRREVLERHPTNYMSTRQTVEAEAADGVVYRFRGEAIAAANVPAWPNASFRDSVFRWEDERTGRVTHATCQELWYDRYQRAIKARIG